MTTLFAKLAIPFPGLMAPFIAILELVVGILLLLGVAEPAGRCRWLRPPATTEVDF
jgi:uncharacterized membrane protein YphA (DoxX/SURF4 family)